MTGTSLTLLRAEWLKLRTVRTPWVLLAVTQVLILVGVFGRLRGASPDEADLALGALEHVGLASLFTLALGTLAMASEYQHRTITGTFLVGPRRDGVLWAKLATYGLGGLVFGLVTAAVATSATAAWFAANGGSLDLSDGEVWLTLAGGVAWTTLFALVGVGLGALTRNLAVALGGALAWLALVEGLVAEFVGSDLAKWLPFAAGSALGRLPVADDGLAPWAGGLVLLGYALGFVALAHRWALPRDVT